MRFVPVTVVHTGVANLASVQAGLRRAGTEPVVTEDPRAAEDAERLALPGVGAFAPGMAKLAARGWVEPLRKRIEAGRPTLAICLGMHFLGSGSEEGCGVPGLSVFAEGAKRFPGDVRVPQIGWNAVTCGEGFRYLCEGYAYYANSYRLDAAPRGWCAAWSDHGGRFVAALERGSVLACQFHPELSGPWGIGLLRRWLGAGGSETGSC